MTDLEEIHQLVLARLLRRALEVEPRLTGDHVNFIVIRQDDIKLGKRAAVSVYAKLLHSKGVIGASAGARISRHSKKFRASRVRLARVPRAVIDLDRIFTVGQTERPIKVSNISAYFQVDAVAFVRQLLIPAYHLAFRVPVNRYDRFRGAAAR